MIPAPCVRAMAPPNARLPTLETKSLSGPAAILGGFRLVLGRPRLLVFVDALGITHSAEDTGARDAGRKADRAVRSGACMPRMMHAWRELPETSAGRRSSRSSGSGCTSGRPPRDVEVPPIPWRKLAIWTGVGAVVLGVALAVMIPRINEGKAERNAAAAAEQARARALNRERVIKLQQPRTGEFAALKPAAGAGPAAEARRARPARGGRRDRDHRRRPQARGAPARSPRSRARRPASPPRAGPTTGPIGVFDCYTVVRKVPKVKTNVAGSIGYPFRAVVDYSTFSYTFCRTEQFPGEQLIPDPRTVVQLPAACQAKSPGTSQRDFAAQYIATLYCVAMENLADELDQRLTALWHTLGRRGKRELSRTAASVLGDAARHRPAAHHRARRAPRPSPSRRMTTLVGRLERDGLVERARRSRRRARRARRTSPTPASSGSTRCAPARAAAARRRASTASTDAERAALAAALPAAGPS